MKQTSTVEVAFGDRNIMVTGLTKHTRCDDVIKMAAHRYTAGGETTSRLAMFEQAYGSERELSPNTRVFKLVRSWGSASSNRLVLRWVKCIQSRMTKIYQARQTLRKLRSLIGEKHGSSPPHKEVVTTRCDTNDRSVDTSSSPASISTPSTRPADTAGPKCQHSGKIALLQRYLSDVVVHTSTASRSRPDTHARTVGDGTRHQHYDVTQTDMYQRDASVLNTAFVSNVREDVEANHEFVSPNEDVYDPNVAFICERIPDADTVYTDTLDNSTGVDAESENCDFKDDNEYEYTFSDASSDTDDELERNICESGYNVLWNTTVASTHSNDKYESIKRIFGSSRGHLIDTDAADDAMESLMRTREYNMDSAGSVSGSDDSSWSAHSC